MIKSRWVGHVAHMGDKVLMGRTEGKKTLGRPGHRWENIKIDLQEVGWEHGFN
jgi:hypothetical protein